MLPGDSHKQNSRVKLVLSIFAIRIKEMKVKTYLWSHHKYLKFSGLRELFQTLRKTSKDYKVHIIVLSSSSPFIENFFPERRVLHSSARVKISWLDSWNQTKLYLVLTKQLYSLAQGEISGKTLPANCDIYGWSGPQPARSLSLFQLQCYVFIFNVKQLFAVICFVKYLSISVQFWFLYFCFML